MTTENYDLFHNPSVLFQDTINLTESHGVFVMVRAGVDIVSREATWEFQALDPATGTIIILLMLIVMCIKHSYLQESHLLIQLLGFFHQTMVPPVKDLSRLASVQMMK